MKHVFALAAVASLAFPGMSSAQNTVAERLAPDQPPLVVGYSGHYSGSGESGAPANSLADIQYAIDAGVEMISISVQLTGDKQHIVRANESLLRNTNVQDVFPEGPPREKGAEPLANPYDLSNFTLEEIKQVQLTDGTDGGVHRIPTLQEALDLIDGRIMAILRISQHDHAGLVDLINQYDAKRLMVFSYDDPKWADAIVAETEAAQVGHTFFVHDDHAAAIEKMVEQYGPDMLMVELRAEQVLPDVVAKAGELGVRLSILGRGADIGLSYGKDDKWAELVKSGLTVFYTDYPAKVAQIVDRQ